MNRKKLQSMIEQSIFLSSEERAYWLEHLPKLDDAACAQLEKILTVPEDTQLQKGFQKYFAALDKAVATVQRSGQAA